MLHLICKIRYYVHSCFKCIAILQSNSLRSSAINYKSLKIAETSSENRENKRKVTQDLYHNF